MAAPHRVRHLPIRFPSKQDPGDTGWHVDGAYEAGEVRGIEPGDLAVGLDRVNCYEHVVIHWAGAVDNRPTARATFMLDEHLRCRADRLPRNTRIPAGVNSP